MWTLKHLTMNDYILKEYPDFTPYSINESFIEIISSINTIYFAGLGNVISNSPYIEKFLCMYFYPRYQDEWIFAKWVHEKDEEINENEIYFNFFKRLVNVLVGNQDKYITLLTAYDSAKSNILGPLKHHTKADSRFNDTPQNQGVFDDPTHTSNISLNEVNEEFDRLYDIEKIKLIDEGIKNIYNEWVNEFQKIFIEKNNYLKEDTEKWDNIWINF